MIGTTLSKYRILEKLGEGGMGAVYRAEDTRLGRHVAIKLLPAVKSADAEARARILAEARAVAQLDHPNICTLYEFDEADGQPFIAMQIVEGESLRDALARGPIEEDRVRAVVAAVASALGAAHARGIVHRDVKCDNILLAESGEIKLTDFGIALLDRDTRLTRADMLVGTPHVMSPEQLAGETATPAADQFSLGVVAYECLTGAQPFAGESVLALMHAVLHHTPEPPMSRRGGLHPGWDAAVMKALAKSADARHATIAEFAKAVAATAPREAAVRRIPGVRSLAVLYFDNLSSDPESDYFCAGITEDLLTDLSKVQGFSVASRNAVGRYRGRSVDIQSVAAELGVDAVLEGSVRRAGNRVRINAQLIDAANGMHLWAERYDRTLEDVFAVQDDITAAIAKSLRGALTTGEARQITAARPESARAYDVYLRGRAYYDAYAREDMQQALECFQRAIEIDPEYALAWAGVADACGQMVDKGWDLDRAWLARGETAARRAVELGPALPETYKALSLNLAMLGRAAEAKELLRKALEIHPSFVPALGNLGSLLVDEGHIAGAERLFRRAIEVDPTDVYLSMLLGWLIGSSGRYGEALEVARRAERWSTGSVFKVALPYMRFVFAAKLGDLALAHSELDAMRAAGVAEEICEVARQAGHIMAGEPVPLPPVSEAVEGFIGRDLITLAGAAAGDATYALRGIQIAERLEPHNWLSNPYWVRFASLLEGIQLDPVIQSWLGDRARRLVWPAEAPPLAEAIRAQFTEFSIESGASSADLL